MLDLSKCKRVAVIGGGTAGWFAALTLRRIFSSIVEVTVIESPDIGIIGVGEGGLLNFIGALRRNTIPEEEFVRETGAAWKLGFAYEGWRGGGRQDCYYHLFGGPGIAEAEWLQNGIFPLIAARIAQGRELHTIVPAFDLISHGVSQDEMKALITGGRSGLTASYHFDSYKVAIFLKKVALSRGVTHRQTHVRKLELAENGYVTAIRMDGETLDVDFIVDASGMHRIGIGKTLGLPWRSFADSLILDRALPFHLPNPGPHPAFLTRAVAMNAGWMWQIPLQDRVGAGYVFSSQHTNEEKAKAEIEAYLGHDITPMPTISFEAGHFEKVWVNNVMALGLSSGFVEPLEATSIGQMLEQLRNFERLVLDGGGVVSDKVIATFNRSNRHCWSCLRDFLRMHYDCPRRDTAFWMDVSRTPCSESYAELRRVLQHRTLRASDMSIYEGSGWHGVFHMLNWMFVAAPLGIIPPTAAQTDLMRLPPDAKAKVQSYLRGLTNDLPSSSGRNAAAH